MAPRLPTRKDRDQPFRVKAEDAEDLEVVSAYLQDAVLPAPEMVFDAEARRFVAILSRFRWERVDDPEQTGEAGQPLYERVHTALRFEEVDAVRSSRLDRTDPALVLDLLSIGWSPPAAGRSGVVELVFAGDSRIRLDVARLSCHVEDLGEPWSTPFRPDHA